MKMQQSDKKYEKVIDILRKAKPVLDSTEEIEDNVLQRIMELQKHGSADSDLVGFLFGWTQINWVRRSLVAASLVLVMMFVLQQSTLMRKINHLTMQMESFKSDAPRVPGEYTDNRLMLLRLSGKRFPFVRINNSDKQVEELFRTIDQLKKEYKALDNIIREDPELNRLIEKELSEIDCNRIKL